MNRIFITHKQGGARKQQGSVIGYPFLLHKVKISTQDAIRLIPETTGFVSVKEDKVNLHIKQSSQLCSG